MRSDNITGISEQVLQAIIDENIGEAESYGRDDLTDRVQILLRDIFKNNTLNAYNLISGTATNALILATLSPTYGAIFCHKNSHIHNDECGAIEFHTGGAKLIGLEGVEGKIHLNELEDAIGQFVIGEPHHSQPSIVSIAQTTEAGTVYTPDEINEIANFAHKHDLKLHMDGARFANALDAIGCSPAEMTWESGVDALSFGTTKNGTLGAEAAIFFNENDDAGFAYRRMRSGHLLSKMRFVSAQILAYLENDLWLQNAKHANAMARKINDGIKGSNRIKFTYPVQSNVMFVEIEDKLREKLADSGFKFYTNTIDGHHYTRLVTAFNTDENVVDRFCQMVKNHT